MLQLGQQALASQPFSRLVGTALTRFDAEGTELRVPIQESLKQQHGFVHGGVVSYLADNALTFAGGAALGTGVVTSEYKINYVRPAIGQELVARAAAVHAGKSQAACRCDIYVVNEGKELLCAIAQGTIARLAAASTAE
ncbi:PaaI family thioesterase [Noviherbaspirillum sp. CPCC 100848]|uniref:Medium/long-chain acyl-CoA thioesterase YigI n=1 Tax=Noviherbaspirillum album TaxID=3080276 RepID=A0ABU6J790_9BURK|nr:PaaI family thioesterase [Noviherbaspirillum sp. CPCC 100848]MEC4719157.1 PaaI family thioesterase [Noviherbaspirillum sp. CPCC 100848]